MNAPLSPELAAAVGELDRKTDRDAIATLRQLVGELARISYQAEAIALAVPAIGVNVTPIRSQIGMVWHQIELAQAALPLEVVKR